MKLVTLYPEYDTMNEKELMNMLNEFESQLVNLNMILEDENEKFETYRVWTNKMKLK